MIAAYGDPGRAPLSTMIPALAQGWTVPRTKFRSGFWPGAIPPFGETRPVSDVTRTVTAPFPASAWCTK